MGIRTSSLPNLSNPSSNTLLIGINVVNETPNNSVKITAANLKSFIVLEPFLMANQSFIKANASYSFANTIANTANSSFVHANVSYGWANASYNFANTTANTLANTEIKLSASYAFSNSLYNFSNSILQVANTGVNIGANSFIQANAAFTKANDSYNYAVAVNGQLQQIYDTANTASIAAQFANTNSTVAYDTAASASDLSQSADSKATQSWLSANSALSLVTNTEIKLASAYNLANTTRDSLQEELLAYPIINAKRFNVVGDGITDDTNNLQNVIDFAQNGTVFIPKGVYLVSSLYLRSGVSVKGDGSNSTIFLTYFDDTTILNYDKNLESSENDNITISSIGIRANGTVNCTSIGIFGNSNTSLSKNIILTDIKIDAEYGYSFNEGIRTSNCKNFIISSVISSNCTNDIVISNSNKGQIVNNILDSDIANNITEIGSSDKNIISTNITRKKISIVGPNTLKVNNIENATE